MNRAIKVIAPIIALAVLAGCGSSGPAVSKASSVSTATAMAAASPAAPAATPSASPSAPAKKSPSQIWEAARDEIKEAKSMRVTAKVEDGGDTYVMDLRLSNEKAVGTIKISDGKITIRRIGKVVYFQADNKFWRENGADAATARTLVHHWVKTTTKDKDVAEMAQVTKVDYFLDAMDGPSIEQLLFKRVPGITIGGRPTIGLFDSGISGKAADENTIYVAATGRPYPMEFLFGKDQAQYMKFTDWNKPISVPAPTDFVSI